MGRIKGASGGPLSKIRAMKVSFCVSIEKIRSLFLAPCSSP